MADIFRNSANRRAAKACLRCRWRRVRCDVTRTDLPCTNCRRDEKDCVVVSRSRMRQGPLVEDVRKVTKTGDEADLGGRYLELSSARAASRRRRTLDTLDAEEIEKTNAQPGLAGHEADLEGRYFEPSSGARVAPQTRGTSDTPDAEEVKTTTAQPGLEDDSPDTLDPRQHTIGETRDTSTIERDLLDIGYLPPAEFVDPPWAGMTTADAEHGDLPPLDSMECTSQPTTPVFTDVPGEQLLQQDPMVLTPGEGGWYDPLGEAGWDDLYKADENHAVVVGALLSASSQLATDEGDQDAGLQAGLLPNDELLQSYVREHDDGMKAPGHCAGSGASDLAPPSKVSGWIENDRSLYFLHGIGIL